MLQLAFKFEINIIKTLCLNSIEYADWDYEGGVDAKGRLLMWFNEKWELWLDLVIQME